MVYAFYMWKLWKWPLVDLNKCVFGSRPRDIENDADNPCFYNLLSFSHSHFWCLYFLCCI